MLTGQISSQALQDVQAHSSSAVMRSNTQLAPTVMSASTPIGGVVTGRAGAGHDLADLEHDLPGVERLAGGVGGAHRRAAAAHGAGVGVEQLLPGEVLDGGGAEVLELGVIRLGSGFIAPLGRSRSRRYMFSGEVNMWRSIVVGRITRNATKLTTWAIHSAWCQPARWVESVDEPRQRVADERPAARTSGRPTWAMRNISARKPVTPMDEERRPGSPRARAGT